MKYAGLLRKFAAMLIPLAFATLAHAGWTPQAQDAVNRFLKSHPSLEGRDFTVQGSICKAETVPGAKFSFP